MKELEDYHWFPQKLRSFQTAFIGYIVYQLGLYKPVVPIINQITMDHNTTQIVDLCSGSGLPSLYIKERLLKNIPVVLTDKFPIEYKAKHNIRYDSNSIDALTVQFEKNSLYTMFNAFHHFSKSDQQTIILNAQKANATLLIVELLTPNFFTLIQVVFTSTIGQLLFTPFIKPFSWLRLIGTYLIPINLLTVTIDGIISVFKSKTKKQYANRLHSLSTANFTVKVDNAVRLKNELILIIAKPII